MSNEEADLEVARDQLLEAGFTFVYVWPWVLEKKHLVVCLRPHHPFLLIDCHVCDRRYSFRKAEIEKMWEVINCLCKGSWHAHDTVRGSVENG